MPSKDSVAVRPRIDSESRGGEGRRDAAFRGTRDDPLREAVITAADAASVESGDPTHVLGDALSASFRA